MPTAPEGGYLTPGGDYLAPGAPALPQTSDPQTSDTLGPWMGPGKVSPGGEGPSAPGHHTQPAYNPADDPPPPYNEVVMEKT